MTTELVAVNRDAVSVISMLENAKSWLATAVETTGPAEIAAAKAQIVTAETYARELRLSKDIQLDAREMVRRAEYALGRSIRKGQAEGTVRTKGDGGYRAHKAVLAADNTEYSKPGPTDFASLAELSGNRVGIYSLVDGVSPEDFEEAITDAKAEGDMSRANVSRKIKNQDGPTTRTERADVIADLASQGYSSRQMPSKVGVSEETIRQIARDFDVEIPADKMMRRTHRHDANRIVSEIVYGLEGTRMSIDLIDYDQLDREQAAHWATSLKDSITALTTLRNHIIKEMTQ